MVQPNASKTDAINSGVLPAPIETASRSVVPAMPRDGLTLLDPATFERALKLAELMSEAKGLPGFYNRSPGTCLSAIEDALRLGISPFVVARNSYQVRPDQPLAYYGKFVTAVINGSPEVVGILDFEHVGPWERIDGKFEIRESRSKKDENGEPKKYAKPCWSGEDEKGVGIIVRGTLKETGEVKELKLDLIQCWPRNSTLWGTDPRQQICYVASRRWADRFAPHILMGINLAEEMPEMIDVSPEGPAKPSGNRLQQFVALNGPKDAQTEDRAQGTQEAHQRPTAPEQRSTAPEPQRAPAGAPAPVTGHPEGEPRRPTMVDVFLPGWGARGESLTVSEASALVLREANGKNQDWIAEVREINPWIHRHRVTRETLDDLARAIEEREDENDSGAE